MAEQLLDLPQIGTHIEQVGGVAVAQAVRMDVFAQIGPPRTFGQHPPGLAGCETPGLTLPARPQRNEERLAQHTRMPSDAEPRRQRLPGGLRNRNDALLDMISSL